MDMSTTARRITAGKWFNCGQTCIAPDYILCPDNLLSTLIDHIQKSLTDFYGTSDPKSNPDYSRIINERHYERVMGYVEKTKGKVVLGGKGDRKERYIQPTVVVVSGRDDALMQEEIFGPVLPILSCPTVADAISFIRQG